MSTTLIFMLVLPLFGGFAFWHLTRNSDVPWQMSLVSVVAGLGLVGIIFGISYGAAVSDTEIWSGKILSKERLHGTYEQPYDCFCTTDNQGNRSCQTCYETHYTVHWQTASTLGKFTIDSADKTTKRVYQLPDPPRYTQIQINDPVSKKMPYTNYVQAVPNSLFAASPKELASRFAGLLPAYPDQIYDYYKVNRFVTPGFSFVDANEWNLDISNLLRDLGPAKQVNAIIVIAKTTDPDYQFALRDHWEGVNKNDVVLLIGSPDGRQIAFASVISWTKNELFKIELTDTVTAMQTIDRGQIISALQQQIAKNFERRRMREFEYLKGEINPPDWLITTTIVLMLLGYVGGGLVINYLHAKETRRRQDFITRRFRR
jgi:hypothetical protein